MADAKWKLDAGGESASLVTTELDSLADGSESSQFALDNSSDLFFVHKIRINLGSITTAAGASVTFRVYGPNADSGSKPLRSKTMEVAAGTGAKVVECMIPTDGFDLDCTVENNLGVSTAASANDVYSYGVFEEVA